MMAAPRTDTVRSESLAFLLQQSLSDDVQVYGLQLDSRKVVPGDLFLALAGEVHDGRTFIEQAVASGAVAVVADAPVGGFVDALPVPLVEVPELAQEVGPIASRFYAEPSRQLPVVGVTGTNGKTTTTRLVAQLARALGECCGSIGTLGASLDNEVSAAINTTPDAVALQGQLAAWHAAGVERVAMEVSSHALVQGRVNGMRFDTAVFTNLSQDHLDYHGSMADYGRAKTRLFARPGLRCSVINADDAYAAQVIAEAHRHSEVVTYSARGAKGADVRVTQLEFDARGARGYLESPWGSSAFASSLAGEFNVANLAAAIACMALGGHSLEAILPLVGQLESVPGRLQSVANERGIQVLVDYAHTPDALKQVLKALRPGVSGELITVFGCGGDRDSGKRSVMGRIACEGSDRVVVTSDNPRSEEPQAIIDDILAGCNGTYSAEVDRARAIAAAIASAVAGDCVLIAGKGHEDYQIIDGQRLHFSDIEQARQALQGGADHDA